jgi:DNA-binding transcriptional ArsR family regulator
MNGKALHEDRVFKAIADPTRRGMLNLLAQQEQTVTELTEQFAMSQSAISQHLRVLREAALVDERKDGRSRIYSINVGSLDVARQRLEAHTEFWASSLERLGSHLRKKHGSKNRV